MPSEKYPEHIFSTHPEISNFLPQEMGRGRDTSKSLSGSEDNYATCARTSEQSGCDT